MMLFVSIDIVEEHIEQVVIVLYGYSYSCYIVIMLYRYYVIQLQCYVVTMLYSYNVMQLLCYIVTMLYGYNVISLQCYIYRYNVMQLLCYIVTILYFIVSYSYYVIQFCSYCIVQLQLLYYRHSLVTNFKIQYNCQYIPCLAILYTDSSESIQKDVYL